MPYARIYIKNEKKQINVDIIKLRDFWKTYSSPGDAAKKVFKFEGKNGQLISCQVLRIAETMDELNEKVAAKRSRVPKLNDTVFEENNNCDDIPQTVTKNKKRKTAEETNAKTSAQIETVGEILHAYQKASETATNTVRKREIATKRTNKVATKETDKSKNGNKTYHQKEKQTADKMGISEDHSCAPETACEDFQLTMSHTASDGDDDVYTQNEDPHIFRPDISPNEDLDRCYKNVADLESELTRWKKKHDDLQSSQQYPLTEATGQRILAVLNALQTGSASSGRIQVEDKAAIRIPIHTNITNIPIRVEGKDIAICAEDEAMIPTTRVGSQPDDAIDLGSGITIKVSVYDSFAKQKRPSQFVSSLAQYIWGVETLGNRCVRKQANVREPQLEDDKKGILIREFRHWLLRKRYPAERLEDEMDCLSKYLNSAITSSRRRTERDNADLQCGKENVGAGQVLKKQKNSTPSQRRPKLDLSSPRKRRSARSTQGKVNKATLKKLQDFERVSESSQSDDPELVGRDVDSEAHTVLDSESSGGSLHSELPDSLAAVHGYESDESVETLQRNAQVNLEKMKSKNSNAGKKIYSGGSNEATRKKRAVDKTSKGSLHASESETETIVLAEQERFKSRKHYRSDTHSKESSSRSSTASKKGNSGGSRKGVKKIEVVRKIPEKIRQRLSESETETGLFSQQERCKSHEQLELNVDSDKESSHSLTASRNAKSGDSAGKAVSKISERSQDTSETDCESETMIADSEQDIFEESGLQSHSNVDSNGETSHGLTVSKWAKSENENLLTLSQPTPALPD